MTRPLVPRLPKPWRPRPWSPLLALAVVAVGVVASAGAGLRAATPARDSAPAATVSHSVQMVNFAFAPQVLNVTSGDSVTWTNQDEAPHTVTTTSGPRSISSPMLSKGQSFTYTFVVPGTYSYYCAVHPDMRAEVVVSPAPAAPSTPSPPVKPSTAVRPEPTRSATATGAAVHPTTPNTTHADHGTTASTAATGSAEASSSSQAAISVPSVTSAAPAAAAPATDAAAAPSPAGAGRPLDPALVLAGLTAGVTVFCLFLVASRRNDEP